METAESKFIEATSTEEKKARLARHYRVNPETGCWEARSRSIQGIPLKRWAWLAYRGEIPANHEVRKDPWECQAPRGTNCVNPAHLRCLPLSTEQIKFLDLVKADREEARAYRD